MFKVVNQATVASLTNPPTNGNGYLAINPDPKPSSAGTYSILVTGWSKPSKFSWDTVPNLLVIGTLYNADAGVRMLLENITANPQVDRVYLLALTKYDLIATPFKSAFSQLQDLGYSVTVVFDTLLGLEELPVKGKMQIEPIVPRQATLDNAKLPAVWSSQLHLGSDLVALHTKLVETVASYGKHVPEREFTYLSNQVSQLVGFDKPEYQDYFSQWVTPAMSSTSQDVSYTYGQRLQPHVEVLLSGSEYNTHRVAQLIQDSDYSNHYSGGMPCLTQLSYFDKELTAIFRSHDIGNAWLPNTQALAWLHYTWYPTLDKSERKLTVVSINAHLYDWYQVKTSGWTPDPIGYFYFKKAGKEYQAFLSDQLVYQTSTKADLQRWVVSAYPSLSTSHAFWVLNAILTL